MTLRKQSQFELFPSAETELRSADSRARLFKDLTLTPENIIVISIVSLMILVVSFSFGVEKGRRMVLASLEKEATPVVMETPASAEKTLPVIAQLPQAEAAPVAASVVKPAITTSPQVVPQTQAVQTQVQPKTTEKKQEIKETILGQYTVQVASFKSKQQAQREASILKSKGYEIFILSKGTYTIVCVGKFSRQEQAKKIIRELKSRYNDCLVRRL